jgi:4-amino-4-deoxy-L-arabinose transferase-like glycosyltransferase
MQDPTDPSLGRDPDGLLAPSPEPWLDRLWAAVAGEAGAMPALVVLVVAGLLLGLGAGPLQGEEPRRGLVALEMALRGNLLVPTTNGALYFNKPPLFNWVLLASAGLFGSWSEWVLRLPTVASALAMALAFWAVARRHLERSTALTATALLLTFPILLFYGTLYAEGDVFYALLVVLQALALFAFEQADRPLAMFVASYLLTALGVLTKGLPSLAFQALTLAAWLALERRWRWLLSWAHLAGLAAFALCAGGYFLAYAGYADPAPFLVKLFLEGTEKTAVGRLGGLARISLQLLAFPLQLAWLCFPAVVFAPGLLVREARARIRSTPFLRFCAVFVLANVAPYWLSPGNRPRYMFPLLPFLAALLAVAHERLAEDGWYARLLRWVMGLALSAAPLALAAVLLTPWRRHLSSPWPWAAVVGLLGALALGYWRAAAARARLLLFLLTLATVRIGYDLVIPQVRRESAEEPFFRGVAAVLNSQYRHEEILLAGEDHDLALSVPLLGRTVTIGEKEFYPYALSFHYTRGRSELLRHASAFEPGKLYLAYVWFRVEAPHEVLRIFDHPVGDRKDLKLIRVRAPAPVRWSQPG